MERESEFERREEAAAAREAAGIGAEPGRDPGRDDDYIPPGESKDPARRAVEEAGGGEAEGFELAEQEMIEHTSHGDEHSTQPIIHDAASEGDEEAAGDGDAVFGEPDEENKPD
jgi:hypothetical protein